MNFRLVPYGSSAAGGVFYVYDGGKNTNDLVVNATASGGGAITQTPINPTVTSSASSSAFSSTPTIANWVFNDGGTASMFATDGNDDSLLN